MNINIDIFTEFEQRLEQSTDLDAADKAITKALQQLGIEHFSYTYYGKDFHTDTPLTYDYATKSVRKWHNYFHAMKYEGLDKTTKNVRDIVVPQIWVTKEQHEQATGRAKAMLADALRQTEPFMQSGMSLPIHGPGNEFSIVTIRHTDIRQLLAEMPFLPGLIHQLCSLYHHKVNLLLLSKLNTLVDCPLTTREIECLQCANKNLDAQATAEHLGITKRTVNFHFANINKKLNCKNKYAAVKIATDRGWLT